GAGWNPSHPEDIIARRNASAKGSERSSDTFDSVRFLDTQLTGTADDGFPARAGGGERNEWQLVDQPRHLLRLDHRRDELGRLHLEVADRLAADPPPVDDRDPRAHPSEHVEQARASR